MRTETLSSYHRRFDVGETLGTGAFSEVKNVTDRRDGRKYAMKIIDKSKCKGKEGMIDTEIDILTRVKHENIISMHDSFQIDGKIYLLMELVTGGELFDDIVSRGKYTEADAGRIVQKILLAVDYLHQLGIAHRDLKPENLLLSDHSQSAKIMISDFGLSKIFNDEEVMKTACGTPGYVAPEVLKRQGYGREVDLWSIGVITYILLCGYPPFYDQNNIELFKQILAGRFEFDKPWWDPISEDAKDFIRKLLVLDPSQRYTTRQALAHPWVLRHCGPAPLPQQDALPPIPASPAKAQLNYGSHAATQQAAANATNLAPSMQKNLQKVISSKHSMRIRQPTTNSSPAPSPTAAHTAGKEHGKGGEKDDSQCVIS
ncbi:calcium/calmodulin-dependent protein kinase 1 [Hyaloraphidium curvatum]|nr:calcium/calmodulin-dependent protein kinase 1 [Hyaloraphidium curvatum]